MSQEFAVYMSQKDAAKACINYLRYRRHAANKKRVGYIHQLLSPRKKFFGLITKPPACTNVREAIIALKSSSDEYGFGCLWDYPALNGRKWGNEAAALLSSIQSGKLKGHVLLGNDMAFLSQWVD